MMPEEKKHFRYPGANSFATEQAHLFMGREDDKERLYELISARQIVVLYGKSGYGKSSLLNAGIIPILQQEQHLSIRLYNKEQGGRLSISPLKTLITSLAFRMQELTWMSTIKANAYPRGELWYWLKQWQYKEPNQPIILFFDQFEELFTYTDDEIEEFGEELRVLLYQNVPDVLSEPSNFVGLNQEQTSFITNKLDIKLVFSIRSDRMSLLNRLNRYVPNILKYCYELDAISETDAKEAIIKPAQLQDQAYASKPFDYEPSIVQAIIKQVKNQHDGKIETATLQIICSYIERQKVIEERQSLINANVLGNIQHIFRDFYQSTLNKLNKQDKDLVSQTIEVNFIQNNQRIPFAEEHLKQEYHLSKTVLDELEKSTLLRKERDTAGRFIYEIGHDTLIEPILEFAKIREQEVKQKRLRKNIAIVGAIALAFLFIIFYVLRLTQKAEQAKEEAQKTLYQLYYQQAKTVKDNGDNILRNKDAETAQYYYDSASVILEKIPETDSIATELKSELQKLLKK